MTNRLHPCVCFACRKSFKRFLLSPKGAGDSTSPICPDCGERTHIMGRNFTVPSKEDEKQWDKVKILLQCGFDVGGSSLCRAHIGIDKYPNKLDQVAEFIRKNWKKRCKHCISVLEKEYGPCPKNQTEIDAFIDLWLK